MFNIYPEDFPKEQYEQNMKWHPHISHRRIVNPESVEAIEYRVEKFSSTITNYYVDIMFRGKLNDCNFWFQEENEAINLFETLVKRLEDSKK